MTNNCSLASLTVEVFKTNVTQATQAMALVTRIQTAFGFEHVNFDLEDCDRILRVEGFDIDPLAIILLLRSEGYLAEVL